MGEVQKFWGYRGDGSQAWIQLYLTVISNLIIYYMYLATYRTWSLYVPICSQKPSKSFLVPKYVNYSLYIDLSTNQVSGGTQATEVNPQLTKLDLSGKVYLTKSRCFWPKTYVYRRYTCPFCKKHHVAFWALLDRIRLWVAMYINVTCYPGPLN